MDYRRTKVVLKGEEMALSRAKFGFGGEAISTLASSLTRNPAVTSVQLQGTSMSAVDFGIFAETALGANSKISSLHIANHAGLLTTGSPTIRLLAAALKENSALKDIALCKTGLDDAAAAELSIAIKSNSGSVLCQFDCKENPITRDGAEHLVRGVLPALRRWAAAHPTPDTSANAWSKQMRMLAHVESDFGRLAQAVEVQEAAIFQLSNQEAPEEGAMARASAELLNLNRRQRGEAAAVSAPGLRRKKSREGWRVFSEELCRYDEASSEEEVD